MIDAEVLGKLQLEPGDVLGIQLNTEMSYLPSEELEAIREQIATWLPTDAKVLILPPRASLYTASTEELKKRLERVVADLHKLPDVAADIIIQVMQGAQPCRVCGYAGTCEDCHS